MTHKDYNAISAAIKSTVPEYRDTDSETVHNFKETQRAVTGVVAEQIAQAMQADNPNFKKERFMSACGF